MEDVRTLLGRISYSRALARELGEQIEAIYAGLLPHGLRYDRDNVQSSGSAPRRSGTEEAAAMQSAESISSTEGWRIGDRQ